MQLRPIQFIASTESLLNKHSAFSSSARSTTLQSGWHQKLACITTRLWLFIATL